MKRLEFYHHLAKYRSPGEHLRVCAPALEANPSRAAVRESGLSVLVPFLQMPFCEYVLWLCSQASVCFAYARGFVIYVAWKVVLSKTEDVCLLFS